MPVLATFFSVRRGRDPFFKFFMQKLFPLQVERYEKEFGMRFLGWYNVAYGWDFDNVMLLQVPDFATIDKLEGDPRSRAIGHRAGEWRSSRPMLAGAATTSSPMRAASSSASSISTSPG